MEGGRCAEGGRGERTRLLLFAMKRTLVGGSLVCLLESSRGSETQGKRKRERRVRERRRKERVL